MENRKPAKSGQQKRGNRPEYIKVLIQERKRQKMTQHELGQKMGLCQKRIAAIESGKNSLRMNTIMAYAQALGKKSIIVLIESDPLL